MVKNGFSQFQGKKVLLLQGPLGAFFKNLALDLEAAGATVFKINFNGGDWFFYPTKAINFNQRLSEWPHFYDTFIQTHHIDVVLLFGDCRPIHQVAHAISVERNLQIGVFEEGYIRPDYITLEQYGVNANSKIPQSPEFYQHLPDTPINEVASIGKSFWFAALWGMIYFTACAIAKPYFRHYQHHRSLSIWQGLFWLRSFGRKWLYGFQQKNELETLIKERDKKYFLLALQVHNDAQIHHHSDFFSVDAFISEVINSFSLNAPPDCHLVIKHHPLDRGFNHYGHLIHVICQRQGLKNRIHYIHDLHLPTLLAHAKGVVVINSTVGLSALDHACPVITCGNAIYDFEGLTYQGSLDSFWKNADSFKVDQNLYFKFLSYLINHTQINGNYYKRLHHVNNHTGINWVLL